MVSRLTSQLNRVFCVGKTIDSDRTICENVDFFCCRYIVRSLFDVWSFGASQDLLVAYIHDYG